MGKYLFLRGNRNKRFFIEIANELVERGHQCFQIMFELGELFYRRNYETVYAPFHISNKEYPISDDTLRRLPIYNITYTEKVLNKEVTTKELKMYKRYMYFIDKYIEEKEIDVICLFNGYNWVDQITIYIAKKRNIKFFIFEDGYFRPYTLTCDPKGINAENSVPREEGFYNLIDVDRVRLKKYLFKPEIPKLQEKTNENLFLVALNKGINMIGSILKLSPKLYSHITFWQGFKYFLFKLAYKKRKSDNIQLPKEYIFVPFQVTRDTQIFYNSPHISNMESLVEHVYRAVTELNRLQNRNIKLIFKEHPEDMSRKKYKSLKRKYQNDENIIFVQKYNLAKLIKNALAVITINSTVGIEALAQYKQVITLGESCYNIKGVVTKCDHPGNLVNILEQVIDSKVDKDKIEKFLYYLRFEYQIEGTIHRPCKITAKNIANRITKVI